MTTSALPRSVAKEPHGPARRTVGARTGGRSERVVNAVLAATIAELGQVGYLALRVEDVATRAHVNKTTVYRRWPTKEELVIAAVREAWDQDDALPDTGRLRTDLVALVQRSLAFFDRPEGRALTRLITVELADPEVERLVRVLKEEVHEHRLEVLRRAEARGEIPPGIDGRMVLDAIFAPVISRVVRFREKVEEAQLERLVDLVVRGVEHGGARLPR